MYLLTALYFLPQLLRDPVPALNRVLQEEIVPEIEPQQHRQPGTIQKGKLTGVLTGAKSYSDHFHLFTTPGDQIIRAVMYC